MIHQFSLAWILCHKIMKIWVSKLKLIQNTLPAEYVASEPVDIPIYVTGFHTLSYSLNYHCFF